jgi:small-conductance mechanosensitive channel
MTDQLGIEIAELIMPWIAILVSLMIAFWTKDFVQNLAQGLKFKMNPAFNEGDTVILGGDDAIIVKIGINQTVFGVYSDRGYTWRYIQNTRIPSLKLEKVINNEVHKDSSLEKAHKLQKLLDEAQSEQIAKNKKEISEIKNGKNNGK